ncbi:clathrin coat assembly protein AP180 [Quillaja saponaria]|uniref:Clathrin coat assembly protein AP180 n=1 Tax=Quillaja saponaria TaxID=32244 RepID=A0AAD7PRG7_QUISA|nr:clathrin coat assembly protein AP180 [Quillaja saponaria]
MQANLEVTILKATTHDEVPMEERYVNEIVQLVSSNKVYAAACAQAIAKRIGRTRNWVVALKSLMLVLRIFQDGDLYFPREVLHAMKRGAKILNLSNFRDDSNSSPWDYTAFVRTFALYLDERLDCFLTGKLQRRFNYHDLDNHHNHSHYHRRKRGNEPGMRDMKPAMLLDRIMYWQRLLERAVGTRPTGAAKTNRLVQISLYAIVQESFDLYRDISGGLALLLDSFFHLQYTSCVNAFQACVKSSKQFDQLCDFYTLCKSIGVGRTSEYPSVQKVSQELIETLQEFLKDQSSFPAQNGRSPVSNHLLLPAPPSKDPGSSSGQQDAYNEQFGTPDRFSSEYGSQCTSLEDLMSVTEAGTSPSRSAETYSEYSELYDKQSRLEDFNSTNDAASTDSLPPPDQARKPSLELVIFEGWDQEDQQMQGTSDSFDGLKDCWDLVLVETTNKPEQTPNGGFEPSTMGNLYDQSSVSPHQYNPFLDDIPQVTPPTTTNTNPTFTTTGNQANFADFFGEAPTSQTAAPTFSAQNPNQATVAPTFSAQTETNGALTFRSHNLDNLSTTTTFNPRNQVMVPTFSSQSSAEINVAPTFHRQNLDNLSTTTFSPRNQILERIAPTFFAQNLDETMVAPTFSARSSTETNVAPTFYAQSSTETKVAPSPFAEDLSATMVAPISPAWSSIETNAAPTFKAQDPNVTKDTLTSSTFSAKSSTETNVKPTFSTQNPKEAMPAPTFHAWGFDETSAAPTFSTKSAAPTDQNDPFEQWPSATASEHMAIVSVNEQSLLQQQQTWLEKQNKIIAKYMT